MKKIFMLVAGLGFCINMQSFAAPTFLLKEDFEGVTLPALPATWTQNTIATTGWKTAGASISFPNANGWFIPAHTKYIVVDDWNKNEKNDSTTLMTPSVNLTGLSGAYLLFDYNFIKAYYT